MREILPLLITALLLSGCSRDERASSSSPSNVLVDAIVWGEVVDGLQAGLSLGGKPKESMTLVFHIRNVGDEPIRILKLSSQSRYWGQNLPVEVTKSGAVQDYRGPVLDPPPPPNQSEYIILTPDESDTVEAGFLSNLWKLTVPFEVDVVFIMRSPPEDERDEWTGVVRSGVLKVRKDS